MICAACGTVLGFAEAPVFIEKKGDRKSDAVVQEREDFLGNSEDIYPQQGQRGTENHTGETVCDIHSEKSFGPGNL